MNSLTSMTRPRPPVTKGMAVAFLITLMIIKYFFPKKIALMIIRYFFPKK